MSTAPASVVETPAPSSTGSSPPHAGAEESGISIASFKGDNLEYCVAVTLSVNRAGDVNEWEGTDADGGPAPLPLLTDEQVALSLFDEVQTAAQNGDTTLKRSAVDGDAKKKMTEFMGLCGAGILPGTSDSAVMKMATLPKGKQAGGKIEWAKMIEKMRKQLVWPGKWLADIKKGDIAKVDSCVFPNRVTRVPVA